MSFSVCLRLSPSYGEFGENVEAAHRKEVLYLINGHGFSVTSIEEENSH